MKEYKVVNLNKKIKLSRDADLKQIQDNMNSLAEEGWELQHIVSPNDLGGALIGIFSKEK